MLKILFTGLLTFNLFACTSGYVKQSVVENNWQAIGEYHGKNGLSEYSLTKLQDLSDKYGNGEVDYPSYQQSYEKAVILYCRPKNAFALGGSGKHYYGACDDFPHAYKFRLDWLMAEQLKSSRM